jgi:2-polyprenyl-6-methoxyphenol hydroxylase-like FAD-dependent oxidoreductase
MHAPHIKVTIYELRTPTTSLYGALTFSPNSLYILDKLRVYQRIKANGFDFEDIVFKDKLNNTTDAYCMGKEAFGYKALRVYRRVVLRELRTVVAERGIEIFYGHRFSKVINESPAGVTFEFVDGTRQTASLLVGSDGIHSQVRQYIQPGLSPVYSGNICITSAVQRSTLRLPTPDFPLPASIRSDLGVVVLAPQDPAGEEILVLTQKQHPEQSKEKWELVRNDKAGLFAAMQLGKEGYPDIVQSALEHLDSDKLSVWPFYVVPTLDTWISQKGNVIIIGDAAHAIPPPAGQGASQALEDAFSLSYLISKLLTLVRREEAFEAWQTYRMERMERVSELTRKLSNRRLPASALEKLSEEDTFVEGAEEGQKWLYDPKIEETVDQLLSSLATTSLVEGTEHQHSCRL